MKFSPQRGTITVQVRLLEKMPENLRLPLEQRLPSSPAKGFVLLAVSDDGPGVPGPHQEKIFERFHQVEQGRPGVGLGLAISRSIVEGHKGVIWVEDGEEGGSTFKVLLPIKA
jgi:two-component system sensor histidine kinase KdpD